MNVKDKEFEVYISEAKILERTREIATKINEEFKDQDPLFIGILNGSFMFAADLMKAVDIPSEITFIKVSSYQATQSTGKVKELVGLQQNIFNRNIILIEDIVDTGRTMEHLITDFKELGPKSISICSLLYKPEALKADLDIRYVGFEIPNRFVLGYGLDYDGYGRNLRDIYQLKE
ncbi:hypoxanthine phosphoribosyltransferase [Xanthovirga aplysinae]|uniref:hypoxanthine phosphoribosyltransferase n=1 Tax=Xanthovirga aplysinae TaxID=2529853 RepID=UPI0012BBD7BF|nr:hypoxanthine phosphoribosyltransferase [Xanthovirga aplysinae]MTI32009.1 hypoxanthine phosphoribosyltransferase [Xanthovirga aplysinae]